MANLKDIRRRIVSVEKTKQITSAMRMVAAAKLRRAQNAVLAARPYAEGMQGTVWEIAASETEGTHPLLAARDEVKKVEFLVVASDRGLCGAFNANILKRADVEVKERLPRLDAISLTLVGRKSLDFFRRRYPDSIRKTITDLGNVEYAHAVELAGLVCEPFLAGEVDEVVIVHSKFVSALTQTPRLVRLLPFVPEPGDEEPGAVLPYTIEPDAEALLRVLVPKAVEVEIFRALLENQAGEHAARMAAMEAATRNTEELIESLTLQYNRARQAAITKELMEIVSGAEAL